MIAAGGGTGSAAPSNHKNSNRNSIESSNLNNSLSGT